MITACFRPLRIALVTALWLVGLCALAQTEAAGSACENAASTAAMRECEVARLKRGDAGMNSAYRSLSARLDAVGRAKLRAAQQAWLRFRAAEAAYQADAARDGTLAPLIAASVQADLTEARRMDLEKALKELK